MTAFRYRYAIFAGLLPALVAVSSGSAGPLPLATPSSSAGPVPLVTPTASAGPVPIDIPPASASPVLLATPAAAAPAGTDALDNLVKDSPFLPAAAGGAVAGQNGPLELRGVIMEQGNYSFSVYDLNSKESYWVRLNETGFPFVVRSYDKTSDTVTVEQQGRTLSLTLAAARTMAVNPAMASQQGPVPTAGPAQTSGPQPSGSTQFPVGPVPSSVTPDEAQRLQRIADEIRRRRAVGKGMPTPTASPAPSTPPKS